MIPVPLINWQPIANMPDDRKDGRCMLLWSDFGSPRVGVWDAEDNFVGWCDAEDSAARITPVYWADINPPP